MGRIPSKFNASMCSLAEDSWGSPSVRQSLLKAADKFAKRPLFGIRKLVIKKKRWRRRRRRRRRKKDTKGEHCVFLRLLDPHTLSYVQ